MDFYGTGSRFDEEFKIELSIAFLVINELKYSVKFKCKV